MNTWQQSGKSPSSNNAAAAPRASGLGGGDWRWHVASHLQTALPLAEDWCPQSLVRGWAEIEETSWAHATFCRLWSRVLLPAVSKQQWPVLSFRVEGLLEDSWWCRETRIAWDWQDQKTIKRCCVVISELAAWVSLVHVNVHPEMKTHSCAGLCALSRRWAHGSAPGRDLKQDCLILLLLYQKEQNSSCITRDKAASREKIVSKQLKLLSNQIQNETFMQRWDTSQETKQWLISNC